MTNKGRFIDGDPELAPNSLNKAGLSSHNPEDNMKNLLTDSRGMARMLESLLRPPPEHVKPTYPDPPRVDNTYGYSHTKVQKPPDTEDKTSSRWLEPSNEYTSSRRKPLGRAPKPDIPGWAVCSVMGAPTPANTGPDQNAGDAVNPPVAQEEIVLCDVIGRELYKKSHGAYAPGEQINRNYDPTVVSKKVTCGMPSKGDPDGHVMRKAMEWFDQNTVSVTSKRQATNRFLHHHALGQVFQPNGNADIKGPDHAYGKMEPMDLYGVAELMSEAEPDLAKTQVATWLKHLINIRSNIQNRDPPFPHLDFLDYFKLADLEKKCGCLPAEVMYSACEEFGIKVDPSLLEPVLKKAGVMHPNRDINYFGFVKVISPRYPLPDLGKTLILPKELQLYESTYQALGNDLKKNLNQGYVERAPAGLQTDRSDRLKPAKVSCQAEKKHLFGETSVRALVSPSLFTQYGLSHRDLLLPRTKSFIRELLDRLKLEVSDSVFEMMWEEGMTRDEQDPKWTEPKVCVETFRNMLDEIIAGHYLQITE